MIRALGSPLLAIACAISATSVSAVEIKRGDHQAFERDRYLNHIAGELNEGKHASIVAALKTAKDDPEAGNEAIADAMTALLADVDWQQEFARIRETLEHAASKGLINAGGQGQNPIFMGQYVRVEKALLEEARAQSYSESFLAIYLSLSELVEGLPFRSLPKDHPLRSRAYSVTGSQWVPVTSYLDRKPHEEVVGASIAASERWDKLKSELQLENLTEQIDLAYLQVQSLMIASEAGATSSDLLPRDSDSKITSALRFFETGLDALKKNDSKKATVLYAAGLRSLFRTEFAVIRNERELAHLLTTRNTLFHLQRIDESGQSMADGQYLYELMRGAKTDAEFHDHSQRFTKWVTTTFDEGVIYELTPYVAPKAAAEKSAGLLQSLASVMPQIKAHFIKEQTWSQSWSTSYNADVERRIDLVEGLAESTSEELRTTRKLDTIIGFFTSSGSIEALYGYFSEAVMMRYSTVDDYYRALDSAFASMRNNRKVYSEGFTAKLRSLINQDTHEYKLWRIYFTRQNFVTAAVAVVLVAEVITFQWHAVPATLAVTATVGKVVIITNSTLNLLDRHHRDGWKGLANIQSAIDVLMVVSLLPRVTPVKVSGGGFWSQVGQHSRNHLALFQHSTGHTMVWLIGGMGVYEIVRAEAIAQNMQEKGFDVSASDIRRRGIRNTAMALMLHMFNRNTQRAGIEKHGAGAEQAFKRLKFSHSDMYHRMRSANPWGGFRYYRGQLAQRWASTKILGKLDAAWFAVTVPAMNWLLVNEAILYSYTTPDAIYDRHNEQQKPLPALRDGETAVLAIGFDRADLLYAGAHSKHFQRNERKLYGDAFSAKEFASPESLVMVLHDHARLNGPIRYLKIAAHGIPGLVATQAAATSPTHPDPQKGYFDHVGEPGYISIAWLREKMSKNHELLKDTFAPDARIILVSCLVGSNYDEGVDLGEDNFVENQGDVFLDLMAETFLQKGGRLDASRRILLGLDMVFGTFLASQHDGALAEEFMDRAPRQGRGLIPLGLYKQQPTGSAGPRFSKAEPDIAMALEKELAAGNIMPSQWMSVGKDPDHGWNQLVFSAERLKGMIFNIQKVWWRYGVALEGPAWAERYNYREVTP